MAELTPEQQAQVELMFEQVLKVEPESRRSFLDSSAVVPNVREEVESLLSFHPTARTQLDTAVVDPDAIAEAVDQVLAHDTTECLNEPDTIGPYRIIKKLGEGGMGSVYLAEQEKPLRRRVAIKLIKLGMDTRGVLARFDAERQALALMNHPNIALVLDAGVSSDGRPYFVMEYVEGACITKYCDQQRMDLASRLRLFGSVCQAIHHAHQKGVIHRDIKPSNVLVGEEDGCAIPKVIDFGVAKATNQRLTEHTLCTEMGVIIGTPEYVSPEQAGPNTSDIDTRTDIYSLGVLLYELLVGALPLESDSFRRLAPNELHRLVREHDPPKPTTRLTGLGARAEEAARNRGTDVRTLRRDVHGDLEWIVMKCLEKDRDRRYPSVAELEADIIHYTRHEPVNAGPPSKAYLVSRFVRRNRVLVTSTVVVLVILMAGIVSTLTFAIRESRQRQTAQAIADFLNHEILASADPEYEPNRDITLREVLDRAATSMQIQFEGTPLVAASIHETIGNAYLGLGAYVAAGRHLREAIQRRTNALGAKHPKTLEVRYQLGAVLIEEGRIDEAERMFLDILKYADIAREEQLSLRARLALGDIHDRRGELEDAERLWLEVLDDQRRNHLDEDELTLTALNNLGLLLRGQARYDEAEPMLREAFDTRARTLGDSHPSTILSAASLGWLYVQMGKYDEAEQLLGDAVHQAGDVFGQEHPRTLSYMSLQAGLYEVTTRQEKALALNRFILQSRQRVLGRDHPDTLSARNTLAQQLVVMDRLSEAEPLWVDTLEATERIHGPNHPSTLAAYHGLSGVRRRLGKLAAALELSSQAVSRARKHLAAGHWYVGAFLTNHGQVLADLKRNDEAADALNEAIRIIQTAFGVNHARTQRVIRLTSDFYREQGQVSKAVELEKRLTPESPSPDAQK